MSEIPWLIEKSSEPLSSAFKAFQSSIIVKVATHSPADQLGLQPDDYLVSVNGQSVSNDSLMDMVLRRQETLQYQFYSKSQNSYIHAKTRAIPLGFVSEQSTASIMKQFKEKGMRSWDDFVILWRRGKWDALLEMSEVTSFKNVLTTLIRRVRPNFLVSSEILFEGAALYELGEPENGIRKIEQFMETFMEFNTTDLHAIAYYYCAKWSKEQGDLDVYQYNLEMAYDSSDGEFEHIVNEMQKSNLNFSSNSQQWVGSLFPAYNVPRLKGIGTVGLEETLKRMPEDGLLPVCLLAGYRGNGPYNDTMKCYFTCYPFIKDRLQPMQVLLGRTDKDSDPHYWYEYEDKVVRAGMPLQLLDDRRMDVAMLLQPNGSPITFLLNKQGTVVFEGSLTDPYDYWQALAETAVAS